MNESDSTSSEAEIVTPEPRDAEQTGRRIVICSDGTGNAPGKTRTNVLIVSRGVSPEDSDGKSQITYYDRGVGTAGKLDTITGGAFGHGLARNVEDAYRFIVENYEPGDRIYIFGFSRGAFTARSIAGLIRQCSVLKKEHAARIPEGYKLYRDPQIHPDHVDSNTFRTNYSHQTPLIEFIGVWDTVGALGIPANRFLEAVKYWTWSKWRGEKPTVSRKPGRRLFSLPRSRHAFHDVTLSSIVKHAYHALAIDERRPIFSPSIWGSTPKNYRLADGNESQQVIRQAWFPGAHSDVGGGNGNVHNSSESLNWIANAARETGLQFKDDFWRDIEQDVAKTGDLSKSPPGLWRFAGSQQRDMSGVSGGTECIHTAAQARKDEIPGYDPENLKNSPLTSC